MKVNFGKAIGNAWKYAANAKRLTVFTLIMLVCAAFFLIPISALLGKVSLGAMNMFALIEVLGWFFVALVIAGLIFLYGHLMFLNNYANQKSLSASARYAKSRYLAFLAALIVIVIITTLVSIIPFLIGTILSIILGFVFYFVEQEIAVSGSGISEAFSNSYDMLKKNKLNEVLTWIISGILSGIVAIIFAIPLIIVVLGSLQAAVTSGVMHALAANAPAIAVTGIIFIVGLALAMLFAIGIKTDVYMQLKKKRK